MTDDGSPLGPGWGVCSGFHFRPGGRPAFAPRCKTRRSCGRRPPSVKWGDMAGPEGARLGGGAREGPRAPLLGAARRWGAGAPSGEGTRAGCHCRWRLRGRGGDRSAGSPTGIRLCCPRGGSHGTTRVVGRRPVVTPGGSKLGEVTKGGRRGSTKCGPWKEEAPRDSGRAGVPPGLSGGRRSGRAVSPLIPSCQGGGSPGPARVGGGPRPPSDMGQATWRFCADFLFSERRTPC